jgi:hypothetical protein
LLSDGVAFHSGAVSNYYPKAVRLHVRRRYKNLAPPEQETSNNKTGPAGEAG